MNVLHDVAEIATKCCKQRALSYLRLTSEIKPDRSQKDPEMNDYSPDIKSGKLPSKTSQ